MKDALHAPCDTALPSGPVDRILLSQRRKLFDAFMKFKHGNAADMTLDIVLPNGDALGKPDYLSAWSDAQERARLHVHALDMQRGELHLPFADAAFDWVCCNEVIEHAGNDARRRQLVAELYRVARKGVFVSTSNRRHPIEFNSGMPLLHLLPHAWWKRLLQWSGSRWGSASLELIEARDLYRYAALLPGSQEHDVGHKRVFGIKAHFFLMIQKAENRERSA